MERENFSSGRPWEAVAGYSRVVKVGRSVHVAGTTATDPAGNVVGGDDLYAQTIQTLRNIEVALGMAGAGLADVVRTRMFVTDMTRWQQAARAHGELFGAIRPASTLVGVTRLVAPQMLIEIEADAVIPEGRPESRS